jgi:hypothetical protein
MPCRRCRYDMNLLPQMRRLVQQACAHYELSAREIILEREFTQNRNGDRLHVPCLRVSIDYPNAWQICELQCDPVSPSRGYYSMSNNNTVMYAVFADGSKRILPAWRGKLITDNKELNQHEYHIRKGYMPIEADKHLL